MNQRGVFYFIGFIIAIAGFLMMDSNMRHRYQQAINNEKMKSISQQPQIKKAALSEADLKFFSEQFKKLASDIDQSLGEPDEIEIKIRDFAQTLNANHYPYLNRVLNDSRQNKQERQLALELLINKAQFETHQILSDFIQDNDFTKDLKQNRQVEFELALRAQAIDGLTFFSDQKLVIKNLENIKIRTQHAFLYDRAGKALSYIQKLDPESGLDSEAQAIKN